MSRQIVITIPEWTEIKGIDNKQFAELLPCYDEMLNMIKNGIPLDEVLDKIRAEIESYEADCILADDSKECKECDKIVFGSIYRIIDKHRKEQE